MKKGFKFYAVIWAILFALFQVLCFATPRYVGNVDKFGGAFWASYAFICAAFIGQLICGWFAFRADSLKKLFYNLSLVRISYTGLVIMLIVGGACMAVPNLPNWVGAVVCAVVLAFTAIAVVKAAAAVVAVEKIDEKVKAS